MPDRWFTARREATPIGPRIRMTRHEADDLGEAFELTEADARALRDDLDRALGDDTRSPILDEIREAVAGWRGTPPEREWDPMHDGDAECAACGEVVAVGPADEWLQGADVCDTCAHEQRGEMLPLLTRAADEIERLRDTRSRTLADAARLLLERAGRLDDRRAAYPEGDPTGRCLTWMAADLRRYAETLAEGALEVPRG